MAQLHDPSPRRGEPCRYPTVSRYHSHSLCEKRVSRLAANVSSVKRRSLSTSTQDHATMTRTTHSRPTFLSLQVLLLPFLSLISYSNATAPSHSHLHRRQAGSSTYANHAPVLNESLHDEEFFTFKSVRSKHMQSSTYLNLQTRFAS